MSSISRVFFFLIIFYFLTTCSFFEGYYSEENNAVVRVGNEYLYSYALKDNIPDFMLKNDSAEAVNSYIDKWIDEELLFIKSETYLSKKVKQEIENQVKTYKRKLYNYHYILKFLSQKMDTNIKEKVLQEYYQNTKVNYILNQDILNILILKIPNIYTKKFYRRLLKALRLRDVKDSIYVKNIAKKFDNLAIAASFDNWVLKQDFLEKTNANSFNKGDIHEVQDSLQNFKFLYKILDLRLKKEIAPFSYVRNKIKNVLLNKRKQNLISQLKKNLKEEGEKKVIIERYTDIK